ncbi:MAG TPA: MFS transporter [Candidatus Dormibacteraeota bacterium]|nr:MFS transporter [Candidatus Dormibacteraeota bacterium]
MQLWRDRTFLPFWLSSTVLALGYQIAFTAVPLVAVVTLQASAGATGVLRAVVALPNLAFGIPAGVWVDRLPRRRVLIAASALAAIVTATIPAAGVAGVISLPQLYLVAFLTGTAGVFRGIAATAYLPSIVERDELLRANTMLATTNSTMGIVGPSLSGLLVQLITAPLALLADALMSLVSVVVLSTIRRPEPPRPARAAHRFRAELVEGITIVIGHPILRWLMLFIASFNLFSSVAQAVFILYMARQLHLPPATIGLVLAAAGPGALLGALMARRGALRIGIGPTIVAGGVTFGAGWLLTPLAAGPPAALVVLLMGSQFLLFAGAQLANVNIQSLRQAVTPDRLLGRVDGSMLLAFQGMIPIGAVLGGLIGQEFGPRSALWVAAAGSLGAMALVAASPLRRVRSLVDTTPISAAAQR